MTAFNFRSLLLAAIVLSNCITWTASRHHYAHNVHQHRTRHRRQGAGLYLPASYVIPGGEGEGPWGEWGEVSPCSRTCGGGVASQKRICLQPGPEGQSLCTGGDTKYFSCQTQDCPEGSVDFRAEQCAEFNDKDFRGVKYNWVPYTKVPNPCELNCMPHGERFYFRHKLQVTDGTRCNDESFDVCVNGKCQPVGCDMMLNSTAREDKCRECRGNGANCRTTEGIIDSQDLMKGYNDVLLIPAGSTNINIEEVSPSNNYLALRAKGGAYYLNGHYHIDFPRSIMIAGALWTYERSQQGFAAPDKLRCLGPTNEPLYLSLLLQDDNVGIRYEYSVSSNSAPPSNKRYNWVHEEFTPCSATCGGGFQTRNVTCRSREELEIVEDSLCDEGLRPPTNQSCSPDPCPAQWEEGPWGECSQRCGSGGVRSREVTCQIIANGIKSIVADKKCFDLLGPKPEVFQKCNEEAPCPTWFVGHWKPCNMLCDEGKQTRQVVCYQKKDGRIEVLDEKDCTEEKPEVEQPCFLQPCDEVDWVTSDWTGCDSCTSKNRTRVVVCSTISRVVVNDSFCSYHNRPEDFQECDKSKLPECEVQWYATQWSKCSANCGDGVQTRKVFCGMYHDDASGEGVEVVDDAKCANLTKYHDTKPCTVPKEECPSQWFAGPWTACTEKCGGGEQYRRVMCYRGDKEATDCDGNTVLDSTQFCNIGPCNPDDLLPVSRTSTVVMDEDEDCEDEDYEEVGLDLSGADLMMSDSPGYAEHESTLETGTDWGSSLSTDEGSGFTTIDSDYTTDDYYTGSGDISTTEEPDSTTASKDKIGSTTTTVIPPTTDKAGATGVTESTLTEDTGSTSSDTDSTSSDTDSTSSDTDSTSSDTGSTSSDTGSTSSDTGSSEETGETGSTKVGETEITKSSASTELGSTKQSGSTSSGEISSSDSDSTEVTTEAGTGSTESSVSTEATETRSSSESGSTSSVEVGSSDTDGAGATTEAGTGSTESTFSTEVKDKGSTSESGSTSSGETSSSDTDSTGVTTEAGTESTESSISTEAKETGSTSESGSTSSSETGSTDTDETGATTEAGTESTESTLSTEVKETGSTSEKSSTSSGETKSTGESSSTGTDETTMTGETKSTGSDETPNTEETSPTESTVTEATNPTDSTVIENTESTETTVSEGSTESTVAEETGSTETSDTDNTEFTESTDTEKTESTVADKTGSTESTVTDKTGSTESTVTDKTESMVTDKTGSTESTVTDKTDSTVTEKAGSTESTVSDKTGSTDSTVTEKAGSTESTVAKGTGSTESTLTDASKTTITSESDLSGTTNTEDTSDTDGTSGVSTDSTTTTRAVPSGSTTTTLAVPTASKSRTAESSSSPSSESSAISTDSSEPTVETEPSTVESSTTSGSSETTEAGSTISAESTTEGAKSSSLGAETSTHSETELPIETTTSLVSESTGAETSTLSELDSTTKTTKSGSSASTTEGSVTTESSTESGEITTESSTEKSSTDSSTTPESTGSEASTIYGTTEGTTTEGSTEESRSTELSTTEGSTGTTIWTKSTIFVPTKKICKPRRKPKCSKTKFGCCPDKKTEASGPFDAGCSKKPRTCKSKESIYGCCPDGVSPAQGENNEGCPVEPCADTLFGCCASDNKTAAQGNDQEGCPPPCASSEYGCCADNETEATGPKKQGCPEAETSTTAALTDTTTETTESSETSEVSTTESSGTSDGSTTNEGTTDVISTTTMDLCSSFEFGCCADNETEALGPDGQGCSCNTTEFGCCPDGASPASGLNNEGCPGSCSTTPHGCCQDGKTPAHGPEFEGCCLLQAFGCCPDNRKPAEGPHLEGCGCQNALHGCCPDNVTIAQGPDNLGCGCQYTQHGCCPDRLTAASGPNNEGCACNTRQFGCCPDGVTIAKGPDQQGCHCRDSKFGCCGDGETPATGPDATGCDCSSSRHGCCPDGRTEAAGPKFLGCTDAPENKQAACSMSTDPGPCHNFTAMWYYDLAYGGCSRFWYGGCDGNGNRFTTKEECEDVCVQPSPKDACKLPSVKGACDADYQRWHYNSTREQCIPFRYGGCLGNANNFDTRELCQKQCEPSSVTGQCDLPIDQGSCAGNFSRWGFNSEAHRCEQFIWGGCEGNSNRFSSEAACQMRCAGTQPPQCTQPQEAGNCTEKEALWSFSQSENRCLPFYYSGCGGNDNRFGSREACEQTCPSAYVPDKCTLPYETGECSNYRERWFYDTTYKTCRQFYYGGCGGNENNFATQAECDSSCSEVKTTTTTTTTTTTARPAESQPQTQRPDEPQPRPSAPERAEFCFNAIDTGPCNNIETRYAYDSELGRCVTFQYGGCGGNQNNFPDEAYCSYYCQPMQDICQLPMLQGPCDDSLMRWFYDPASDSCSQFTYGGCEGNDNRFESLEACENRCRTGPAPAAPTTPTTTAIVNGPPECRVSESLEECRYGGVVWYFEASRHECVSHANQEAGALCRYTGTFPTQEACERSCGAFVGVDVCKQRMDPGPCQSYVTKFYFEPATGQCHEFSYGGCLGGANRFSTIEECSQVCKAEIDPCTLPPEGGNCLLYIRQWYYDPSGDQCHQFVYTGCSGNDNRFESQSDCETRCKRPGLTTTTVATPPQQQAEAECKTPSSLAPCGNNVTVFYYDSERGECLVSGIGGCGHPNTYSTEEECERRCGAFRGIDVCGARLDPGPCRASIPKIYWDAMTGSCQQFAYGGCGGGSNRFSSVEECMNVCGDTGPARACLQAADSGQLCDAVPARRWHYSAAHVDCVAFVYLGCGGNDNNFHSYAHCADACRVPTVNDCTAYQQECEALDCQYGVDRFTQDGCQRCVCREDPCTRANCRASERCVAIAMRNPATQEPEYSARCVFEDNEIHNCAEHEANCSRLRCQYGIQRARLPDGCDQCSCVQVEIDCEPLKQDCARLNCTYGIERIIGADGCERCKCKANPCEWMSCAAGERCVVERYVNALDVEPQFAAECRIIVKVGACPIDETTTNEVKCRHECTDDAGCRGAGKCCRRGCSEICLLPEEETSPHPLFTTTIAPNLPAAPQALPQQEPKVEASEGGAATLRCLFHGNPPPKITWRFGELTIDGNAGRYRLKSDGALEIVSLYRNDTGVYICVADNGLGQARQEIRLVVNDPVRMPVGIAGDENAVVTGELGQPLHVRCLAYGYPPPSVFWYHGYGGAMVPYNDAVYEARGNVLLIRSLAIETLGEYTCQAYNGEGKAASWVVLVRAYMPEGLFIESDFLVSRDTLAPRPKTQAPTTAETTTTTTTTTTEAPVPLFTVPVSAHLSSPASTLNIGADLHLSCEVDGFPDPDVYWTKDGVNIQPDGRITITGSTIVSRLTVTRVTVADSGLYACHASNAYSSQSDTSQINVQQLMVPAKCTDNPFFANCDLIVRSKFCRHKYYSKFCCKSCVEAGQLDPVEAELQADQPLKKK